MNKSLLREELQIYSSENKHIKKIVDDIVNQLKSYAKNSGAYNVEIDLDKINSTDSFLVPVKLSKEQMQAIVTALEIKGLSIYPEKSPQNIIRVYWN